MSDIGETRVVANARLELLRCLAWFRDEFGAQEHAPKGLPLYGAAEWQNAPDDILLAGRECAAMGEIVMHEVPYYVATFAITDLGYDRIRAHDVIGEAAQEVPA